MAFKMIQDYQFDIARISFTENANSPRVKWLNSLIQSDKDLYKSLGIWTSPGD
jgi:hypothetical protein